MCPWLAAQSRTSLEGPYCHHTRRFGASGNYCARVRIRKIDTISIVSYDENEKQTQPIILKACQVEDFGKGWLVVDDLVDTGTTAKIVRDMLPQAHITAIYAKPYGKEHVDSFMTEVSQDTWIVFPWEEEI